jgi:hypothetical protein
MACIAAPEPADGISSFPAPARPAAAAECDLFARRDAFQNDAARQQAFCSRSAWTCLAET